MPLMEIRHFAYSEADGVATVRLDRPERLNALTFDSYRELTETFAALATRDSVRVARRPSRCLHAPSLPRPAVQPAGASRPLRLWATQAPVYSSWFGHTNLPGP